MLENFKNKCRLNFWYYPKRFFVLSFWIFTLMSITEIYGVNAETGNIIATNEFNFPSYLFGAANLVPTTNYSLFIFDITDYNTISRYRITLDTTLSFPNEANQTTFSCNKNCSGNGYAYYSKTTKNITWSFADGFRITGTPFSIIYTDNIFSSWSLQTFSENGVVITDSGRPIAIADSNFYNTRNHALYGWNGGSTITNHEALFVAIANTINYNITYDGNGNYIAIIDKSPSIINSKIYFNSSTLYQFSETSFNKINFSILLPQLDGIYLNHTLQAGGYNNTLINSSGISTVATANISIPKTNYNLTETVNISYTSNVNGRIKILNPNGEEQTYSVFSGSGYQYYYIASNAMLGLYDVRFEYFFNGAYYGLDELSFNVFTLNNESKVTFDQKNYLLSDGIYYTYFANNSDMYINVFNPSNILVHNNSNLLINASNFSYFKLSQSSEIGIYTIKLTNISGIISTDTTYINYDIINSTVVTPSSTSNPTSILDASNQISEAFMGKITNDEGELDDVHIKSAGNKIAQTLYFLVFLCLIFGIYHKWKRHD